MYMQPNPDPAHARIRNDAAHVVPQALHAHQVWQTLAGSDKAVTEKCVHTCAPTQPGATNGQLRSPVPRRSQ